MNTVERIFLKKEIKKLKALLVEDFEHFMCSKNIAGSAVSAITGRLWKTHELQCLLNATYKSMDERTILERVAKRRGKSGS